MQARCFFDNLGSAAKGLEVLFLDARSTDKNYRFEGLSVEQVKSAGLFLDGDIAEVCEKLETVAGAAVYREEEANG